MERIRPLEERLAAVGEDMLLRRRDVEELCGIARSTIDRRIAAGSFPEPVRIAGLTRRWRYRDVAEWLALYGRRQPTQ